MTIPQMPGSDSAGSDRPKDRAADANLPTDANNRNSDNRIAVALIYGGASPEHSVSCTSAGIVMNHIDTSKYRVVPIGITRGGAWTVGTTDTEKLIKSGRTMHSVPELGQAAAGEEIALSVNPSRAGELLYVAGDRAGEVFDTVDVVFPVLHGPNGEDGHLQGLLELSKVPYVGPGVLASSVGMDKERTKNLLQAHDLPIGKQWVLHRDEVLPDEVKDEFGLPVFVKPARGGSSIGISKVDDWSDLERAVELAREHDWKVIVEQGIVGAEVECGVLQRPDGTIEVSLPAMLTGTDASDEGFYGFDTKYLDNVVDVQIPADLADDVIAEVQQLSRQTFRALGCDGLTRVDFFVTESGPVINEVNTMPGLTPASAYPMMFKAAGIEFPEVVDILIQRAFTAQR